MESDVPRYVRCSLCREITQNLNHICHKCGGENVGVFTSYAEDLPDGNDGIELKPEPETIEQTLSKLAEAQATLARMIEETRLAISSYALQTERRIVAIERYLPALAEAHAGSIAGPSSIDNYGNLLPMETTEVENDAPG